MKYLFIIGFVLLSITGLMAQADFRNGYIINNNNDTIYGLIDFKGNKANATRCVYKEKIHSGIEQFSPYDIKGYRFINSKYYVSRIINADKEIKRVFLEYLINGIIDIYYYRDSKGEHYLIDFGDSTLYELKNEEREIIINNTRHVTNSNEYIGLLKAAFKESSTITNEVENIGLNHKSLINITHDYHNEVCADGACIIYEKALPKIKNTFGIVAGFNGMSISQTQDFTDDLYYLEDSRFGFNLFPSIGLSYKINMPYINERLYFQYEVLYSRVNLSTSNSYTEPVQMMNYANDISLTQNSIHNLGFIKYEYPKGKIRPTFQMGGFVKYIFNTTYNRNLEVKFSNGNTFYTSQINENPFAKYDFGVLCGFGIRSSYLNEREMFVDFTYQRGFGLLKGLNTNTFSINAGFQIGK